MIEYRSVDDSKATDTEKETIAAVQDGSKKQVLKTASVLPIAMCVAYVLLMMYFTSQGGYKTVELTGGQDTAEASSEEEAADTMSVDTDAGSYGDDT